MILFSTLESNIDTNEAFIARWANADDQRHAERKKNARAAHNSLLTRALLRRLLDGNQEEILVAENGKPYFKKGPFFSVTHSRDMVAAAICAEFPIGIDVEFHSERDLAKLAAYAFGPKENEDVARCGGEAFYRIWTTREAITKISGDSVFKGMNGQDVDLKKWSVFYQSPRKDYSFALAAKNLASPLENMLKFIDIGS